ncbi:ACT domain-containing protein [Sulfoacidibacillus ferrooxidans]|nr:ACT domain-containing protein [Sulfoacidibacillus ferrooxidans]
MAEDSYYLIAYSHLPDVIKRTIQVADFLKRQPRSSVSDAVRAVGISRSAYYKYKDAAKPFHAVMQGQIVTIALTLKHHSGSLSEVLNTLAVQRANILTINQSLPLQGSATVILSIETRELRAELEETLQLLRGLDGVSQVMIVGQG